MDEVLSGRRGRAGYGEAALKQRNGLEQAWSLKREVMFGTGDPAGAAGMIHRQGGRNNRKSDYDTGGYDADWGGSGKFRIVDQGGLG